MDSFSSDSDEGSVNSVQGFVEYDGNVNGPLKLKGEILERAKGKSQNVKELRGQVIDLTLWFSLRLISMLLVAYAKDIAAPSNRVEKRWEEHADACIKERGPTSSNSAERLRNEEYSFFRVLSTSDRYSHGAALDEMQDDIVRLLAEHPKRVGFLRVCGFHLFAAFLDVDETSDIRVTSQFPPPGSTYALMRIIGSISDKDIARCVTHSRSCFRDSRIGRWLNFVARYPADLSGSSRVSEYAARIVERWKKIVDDAQRGVLDFEHSSDEDGYEDEDEQLPKEKRLGKDIAEYERQMAYVAATLAQGEDSEGDRAVRSYKR